MTQCTLNTIELTIIWLDVNTHKHTHRDYRVLFFGRYVPIYKEDEHTFIYVAIFSYYNSVWNRFIPSHLAFKYRGFVQLYNITRMLDCLRCCFCKLMWNKKIKFSKF